MTYIVKDECIKCKLTDCVEVCPVDCFYEGENMLVIIPMNVLIVEYVSLNVRLMRLCPIPMKLKTKKNGLRLIKNIQQSGLTFLKKDPMPNHENYKNMKNKLKDHFSEKPENKMPRKKSKKVKLKKKK